MSLQVQDKHNVADRPNIIQIVADDMGYGDFGVFSDGRARTPALDRLVAEGVCLTQHYSASPVCNPARASLLTGRYPHRTGSIDTWEGRGLDRLALRERTLADDLRPAGYATGLVGKWHLGALDERFHPNRRGFDEFAGFSGGWHRYWQWRLDRNGRFEDADGRYLTDVFTEESVGFIERHAHRPFYLQVAYSAPHFPFEAPEADVRPFAATGRYSRLVCLIYAMIARMDAGIGRILDTLDRLGLRENTLVMFISDNGPQLGPWGDDSTDRFNCGLRGRKELVYEGGIRVPAVLRWPAGLPAGQDVHEMVHFCDWAPTLHAAAGIETPRGRKLDGQNALAVLRGEPAKANPRRFWQWNRYTPVGQSNAAMRDGPWKLVRPAIAETLAISQDDVEFDQSLKLHPDLHHDICHEPPPPRVVPPPPPPLLFNLETDPFERHDLAAAEPARTHRMLGELETWFEAVEAERRTIRD